MREYAREAIQHVPVIKKRVRFYRVEYGVYDDFFAAIILAALETSGNALARIIHGCSVYLYLQGCHGIPEVSLFKQADPVNKAVEYHVDYLGKAFFFSHEHEYSTKSASDRDSILANTRFYTSYDN